MTELTAFARLHIFSLAGHNPHTAYLTEAGGIQVRQDDREIKIKQVTSATVAAAGSPKAFLKQTWPGVVIEAPPFDPDWTMPEPEAADASVALA